MNLRCSLSINLLGTQNQQWDEEPHRVLVPANFFLDARNERNYRRALVLRVILSTAGGDVVSGDSGPAADPETPLPVIASRMLEQAEAPKLSGNIRSARSKGPGLNKNP